VTAVAGVVMEALTKTACQRLRQLHLLALLRVLWATTQWDSE
jgi:hypothetical protein